MRWLTERTTDRQKFKHVILFTFFILLYLNVARAILIFLAIHTSLPVETAGLYTAGNLAAFSLLNLVFTLGSAFLEERIFRLPLAIFIGKNIDLENILVIAVLLSVLFGLAHVNGTVAGQRIFVQGVSGFILSVLFLKCGMQGDYGKALMATTFTHFLYNVSLEGFGI